MDLKQDEVKLARTAGFCWGVKRAMDMALETAASASGPVYTHGPLIHNPQVIGMLEEKKVFAVEDATALERGVVIIRTHGVTPETRRALKERGLVIHDATCPLVARVQGIIKKHAHKGYHTVIIGDRGHAEVAGLLGYAAGRGHVIGSVEEARALPGMDKVCVVAQTTCDTRRYAEIVEALAARWPDAVVADTICDATVERQTEVRELAAQVDLMVVVGGRNSANTARLAQIAGEEGAAAMLVESEEELDAGEVARYRRIGLTAGASTPTWMIQRVLDRLRRQMRVRPPAPAETLRGALDALVISKVSTAAGAALMVYANSVLGGYAFSWRAALIAGCYIFGMYALNQLSDAQTLKHNEPEKLRFYLRHQRAITAAAGMAVAASLAAAVTLGLSTALLYVVALLMGLAYTVKWLPRNETIRVHRLKDIPASKDVFVGVAWVMVAVVVPALASGGALLEAGVGVAAVFTFTLVYIRNVLSDIRDIHGDRLVGRETIPILIGKTATKYFLGVLCAGLAAALIAAAAAGWVGGFGYAALGAVAYTALYLTLYHWRVINRGVAFDLAIDGVFHVTGALALLWVFIA